MNEPMPRLAVRVKRAATAYRKARADAEADGPALIERVLRKHGWSLRELARRSGLSGAYLSAVRTGKTKISIGAYIRLCMYEGGCTPTNNERV